MVFFLAGTDTTPTGFTGQHDRPVHTEPTMPLPSGGLSGTSGGDGGELAEKTEEHKARTSPSERTRLFLLESKRKQQEEEDAGLRPKRVARTTAKKSPPKPVDSAATQHEQNQKQDKDDVVAELFPEKPKDWGLPPPVTSDQQEPPKPRGRKPKASKVEAEGDANKAKGDSSNTKKKRNKKQELLESKASAEAAATTAPKTRKRRKIANQPTEYQPMEVDGNINMDKGAAFDAYAAAASAVDIAKLKRQDMVNEDANTTAATVAPGTSRRKRGKQSEQKDSEHSGTKKSDQQAKKTQDKKKQKEDEKKGTGDTDSKVPKVKTAEAKARYSRKSCAYKKGLKEAQDKGASIEEAKAAAKEVPYN